MLTNSARAGNHPKASFSLTPAPAWDSSTPPTWMGSASVHLGASRTSEEIVDVSFTLREVDASLPHDVERWGERRLDQELTFEVPRVARAHRSDDIDLGLVAGVMARLSVGRNILVLLTAEPWGWQSFTLSRREADIPAIAQRWKLLGFDSCLSAYSCQPETLARTAHDYTVPPELASWGQRFERAEMIDLPASLPNCLGPMQEPL